MSFDTSISGSAPLATTVSVQALGVPTATELGVLATSLSVESAPVMVTLINVGIQGPPGPAGITVSATPPLDPEIGGLVARYFLTHWRQ